MFKIPILMSELKLVLEALLDFKGEKIRDFCERKLGEGTSAYEILQELNRGLDEIGKGYENKEFRRYFESDLIVSGANMRRAIEILKPELEKEARKETKRRGKVLIGTVKGDVHDIGKTIAGIVLQSNGFEIIDLGTDVDKATFVNKVRELKPDIVGMSALLSSTVPYMGEVIKALEAEGLRNRVKVIVGGRAVSKEFAERIGADAYAEDAIDGLKKCISLMEGKE